MDRARFSRSRQAGGYTLLHSFDGADGSEPDAGLVLGSDGDFYGDTALGGANVSCSCGTIFKISPTGTLATLHSFDVTDGYAPFAPLVQGADGSFYGTTSGGRGEHHVQRNRMRNGI